MERRGRIIDMAAAPDDEIITYDDLCATLRRSRSAINARIRSGELPPPQDRRGHGGAYRWSVGYLRAYAQRRAEALAEAAVARMPRKKPLERRRCSEFD